MRKIKSVTVLVMVLLQAGCASTAFEGYQPDGRYCFRISKRKVCTVDPVPMVEAEVEAKKFEPLPDRSVVWLVRDAPLDPFGKVTVTIQGQQVMMLPHTVARIALPSGAINLVAHLGSRDIDALTIAGTPGEQLFVEVHADVGLFATCFSLRRIPDDDGRRKALASKLIKDSTTRASVDR